MTRTARVYITRAFCLSITEFFYFLTLRPKIKNPRKSLFIKDFRGKQVLFPLDSCIRLRGQIVANVVDVFYFCQDPVRYPVQDRPIKLLVSYAHEISF